MARSRREFLTGSAFALVGGALGPSAVAHAWQQPPAPTPPAVVPVFTSVRRNVGFFTGRGGTIGYLLAPGGVVVIDSQFPDSAQLCLAGLNERSGHRPIDMLINTHHHGDHTGGNMTFRGATKKVVAHQRAAEHMKQPPGRPAPTTEQFYPTETFTDTWRTTVGDEVIRAKHHGVAHSGGDAVITFERANVVHMGDLVFHRRHPVVDRPAGASLRNWIVVLEKTVEEHPADASYIFGHAGTNAPVIGSRVEVLGMRDYLTALLDHVQAERKAGKSRDVIIAMTHPLAKFEGHGPLTPQVMTAAYDELAGV